MKVVFALFFVFCFFTFGKATKKETSKGFIITLKSDTLPVDILKTHYNRIVCIKDGKRKVFRAKSILGYIHNGSLFESGKVRDKAILFWIRWIFMKKVVAGKINYYQITVNENKYDTRGYQSGKNYVVESSISNISVTLGYIRRNDEKRGRFVRMGGFWRYNLEKLVYDCPKLLQKMDEGYWSPDFEWYIGYYNNGCAEPVKSEDK